MLATANAAVDAVYHSDWGLIVATLIRQFGDFDVAEECAQEAFTSAVDQWRKDGIPEFPRAWIIQTAKHKAIDRLRRQTRFEERWSRMLTQDSSRQSLSPTTTLTRYQTIGCDLSSLVVTPPWLSMRKSH